MGSQTGPQWAPSRKLEIDRDGILDRSAVQSPIPRVLGLWAQKVGVDRSLASS